MYQSIITEVDDTVGILTLNKPERHNALDETLIAEITDGLLSRSRSARAHYRALVGRKAFVLVQT